LRNRIETEVGLLVPTSRLLGSATPGELAYELTGMLTTSEPIVTAPAQRTAHIEGEI
jgi:hypothetical protein